MKKLIIAILCFVILYSIGIFIIIRATNSQIIIPVLDREITFRVDNSFSKEQVNKIQMALDKWNIAAEGCFKLKMRIENIPINDLFNWKQDGVSTVYNSLSIFSWKRYLARYICDNLCIGVTLPITGDVFMIGSGEDMFESIFLHEVGHILMGPAHSIVESDLMYPIMSNPKNISEGERERVRDCR